MKKFILSILSILFLNSCQNSTIRKEEDVIINNNKINIKYLNFIPKEINKTCMEERTKKLFEAIENNEVNIFMSIFSIQHEYYKQLYSEKSLIFENYNKNIFILFSIEKNQFFLSQKAFNKNNDESFSLYELINKIDFTKCMNI